MGAEIFVPYRYCSEPTDDTIDSKDHWQMCMTAMRLVTLFRCCCQSRRERNNGRRNHFTVLPYHDPMVKLLHKPIVRMNVLFMLSLI